MKKTYITPETYALEMIAQESMLLTASGKENTDVSAEDNVTFESKKRGWSSDNWDN